MMRLLDNYRFRVFVLIPLTILTVQITAFYFFSANRHNQLQKNMHDISHSYLPLLETYLQIKGDFDSLLTEYPDLKLSKPYYWVKGDSAGNSADLYLFWKDKIDRYLTASYCGEGFCYQENHYAVFPYSFNRQKGYICYQISFDTVFEDENNFYFSWSYLTLLNIIIPVIIIFLLIWWGQKRYYATINEILMRIFVKDELPVEKIKPYITDKKFLKKLIKIHARLSGVKRAMDNYIVQIDEEVEKRTRELKDTNILLSQVVDNELIGIILTDENYKVTLFNLGASKMTDFSEAEMLNNNFFDLLNPEFRIKKIKNELARRNRVAIYELNLSQKDGGETSVYLTGSYFHQDATDKNNYIFILVDIGEQKELYRQLLHSQKMENIGLIAGGLAHDFNNILGSITGYANLLKSQCENDIEAYEMASIIEGSGLRAAELIRSLLNYAKGIKQEDNVFNLRQLLNETYLLLKKTISKTIDFHIEVQPELYGIKGNASQIQQCVVNLCLNAKQAMPEGGQLTIHAGNIDKGRERFVRISIVDTGVGIPEEIKEQIFDPFFSTKNTEVATGLGLTMVKKIINEHGGKIEISSHPEKTKFDLILPATETNRKKKVENKNSVQLDGHGKTVLIVDDEDSILMLLAQFLKQFNFKSIKSVNGREGLTHLEANHEEICLVILDYMMPVMNGKEMYREMQKKYSDIPVILLTGVDDDAVLQWFLDNGISDVIRKPFTGAEIIEKINNIVNK